MISVISATLFLIYLNVPAVLVSDYGLPTMLALLLPLLLAVPVAYRVMLRGEALRVPGMIIAALIMLALHTLSALLSERPHLALETVFSWLAEGILLAFLLVNALRTRQEVFAAARAIVAAGAMMGFIVVLQQMLGPTEHGMAGFGKVDSPHLDKAQYQLAGPIGEKNRFAQIMAVLIPLAVGLGVVAPLRQRWLYGVAAVLICCGVALSFSRGAILALVLTIPFALYFGLVRMRHVSLAVLAVAVLLMAMPFMSAMPLLTKRVASIGDVVVQSLGLKPGGLRAADGASRGRLTSMGSAGLLFLDHPLIGAGPGLAPIYYRQYSVLVGGKVRAETRRTHNLYLQLAAETGLIGLLAFLAVIWMTMYPVNQARRRTRYSDRQLWGLLCGIELGLLVFLATSMFLHAAYIRYCWLLLALAVAAAALPCRAIQPEFVPMVIRNLQRRLQQKPRTLAGPETLTGSGRA